MPSSPGYVRDYKQERKTAIKRGEQGPHSENAVRLKARRGAIKLGMVKRNDGKDIDHRKPLVKNGSNKPSNWRVRSEHANRSFPRTKDAGMK